MKFMKESKDVKEKLNKVMADLEQNNSDEADSEEDSNPKPKLKSLALKNITNLKDKAKKLEQIPSLKGKYNARQKNSLNIDTDSNNQHDNQPDKKQNKPNKITLDIVEEVNQDAKKYTKEKQNLELTESEIKKIVDIEEVKNDKSSFYENFFVRNDEVYFNFIYKLVFRIKKPLMMN